MAFRYSPRIIDNGLVLYLDAANPTSYVSGSLNWNDLSRSQLSGSIINSSYSSANNGSLVFNGSTSYIPTNNIFNNLAGTWVSWFNPNTISPAGVYGRRILHQSSDGSGNHEINIAHANGSISWWGYTSGTTYPWNIVVTSSIAINNWYQVVGTYDGSNAFLYLNGTLISSMVQTGSVGNATNPLYIGRVGFTNVGAYSGNIASVSIYNRALSSDEVLQNYNATKGRFGLT